MPLANTASSYGAVARFFHWTTALLILTAIPLGLIAHGLPYDTDAELARKATLFSIHKTVGVTAFFVALARILWAVVQPKPAPVHPERGLETWAAETAHWLLYTSMVIVPLSGWLHHAATTGFAPILWPFGQTLPFVPVSPAVADFFGAWHWVFTKVLGLAVFLHIAGALKHAVIDRDGVLARMATGRPAGSERGHASRVPFLSASLVVAAAIAGGTALGWPKAATRNRGPCGGGKRLDRRERDARDLRSAAWQQRRGKLRRVDGGDRLSTQTPRARSKAVSRSPSPSRR